MTDDPKPSGASAVRRPVLRVRLARPSQPVEVVDLSERSGEAPLETVVSPVGSGPDGLGRDHWCLAESALFQDLSAAEMAAIGEQAPARTVASGQVVYAPQRPMPLLHIVKRGRVRLYRVGLDGRTVTTALAGPGSVFGEMRLLGLRMGGTWAEAMEATVLCLMSEHDVRSMLLSDPRVAARIAEQLGARVAELEDRLADMVHKTLDERVASALLRLTGGRAEAVRLTHEQLAQLVGTSRERATRALGDLAARDLVRPRRGRVLVRDPVRLAAHADGAGRGVPVSAR